MDAIEVSLDMLERFCGNRKYRKRLFLITDGEKAIEKDFSRVRNAVDLMQERDVRLNVITLDFANELGQDDESDESDKENEIAEEIAGLNGPSDAGKKKKKASDLGPKETANQMRNKQFLIDLASQIKGAIFPASVAMEVCKQFKKREVMSRARYRGTFDVAEDLKLGV